MQNVAYSGTALSPSFSPKIIREKRMAHTGLKFTDAPLYFLMFPTYSTR